MKAGNNVRQRQYAKNTCVHIVYDVVQQCDLNITAVTTQQQ